MRFKAIFHNFIVLFLSVILCLVVFELYLRIFNKVSTVIWTCDPLVGGILAPNQKSRCVGKEFNVIIETNSLGFRDVEWRVDKKPDVFRIVVLGDSFMMGLQVPYEDLFIKRLENKLNNLTSKRRFEVLNFGINEMGTVQQYEVLRHYALRYDPDLVILAFFIQNDLRNNMPQLDNYNYKPYYRLNASGELEYIPFEIPEEVKNKLRNFIKKHIRLAGFFVYRIRHNQYLEKFFIKIGLLTNIYNSEPRIDDIPTSFYVYEKEYRPVWDDAWVITLKMIVKIKELCEENNAEFFLANLTQAPLVREETDRYFEAYPRMKEYEWDFLKPYRLLDDFCRKEDIYYIDLLYPFKEYYQRTKRPLHYIHDGHMNTEGMELAAELVFKELIRTKVVPAKEDI